MPLGTEVDLCPGDTVLDGDRAPPKGHSPQFLTHVCYGQKGGWIKMLLRTEVGLSPGDIVLDGDPVPRKRGHSTPTFCPMSVVAKQLNES